MRAPARVLAWLSIGLGVLELSMPRKVIRLTGAPDMPDVVRAYGLREIGTGIGLLTSKDPSPWLWARVAGDVIDVATVGRGFLSGHRPVRALSAVALLLGMAYVDAKVAQGAPPKSKRSQRPRRDYSDRSGFPVPAAQMRGVGLQPSARMTKAHDDSPGNDAFVTGMPLPGLATGKATEKEREQALSK